MNSEQDKTTKKRCTQCKKKLGVIEYKCKCEKLFCISHLQPQDHACAFDYKAEADKILIKHLNTEPKASSFERI